MIAMLLERGFVNFNYEYIKKLIGVEFDGRTKPNFSYRYPIFVGNFCIYNDFGG